jgi:hypothetical protein
MPNEAFKAEQSSRPSVVLQSFIRRSWFVLESSVSRPSIVRQSSVRLVSHNLIEEHLLAEQHE